MGEMRRVACARMLLTVLSGQVGLAAAVEVDVEPIALAVTGAQRGDTVSGELRLPRGAPAPMAAVLILHSSPGFDGRGAALAEALHRAGIATVEIDYLRGRGIPVSPRDNLPQVFQTLGHLAAHPLLDAARIGVLGFSWGGVLALLASSAKVADDYGAGKRFAAHAGLYPVCWRHHAIATGRSDWFGRQTYARLTGRPVLILAAGRDAFDADAETCHRFVAALPGQAQAVVKVTVYPTATFGWDSRFDSATYDVGVARGRGGLNTIVADPEIARQSREAVASFFAVSLAPPR